jgi:hypothetical protein
VPDAAAPDMIAPGSTPPPTGLTGYSRERPVILLTDYPADTEGGGAVILRSLLPDSEREKVVWASFHPPSDPSKVGFETHTLRRGSHGRTSRRRRSVGLDQTVFARDLADELLDFARERNARAFWVVLHGAAVQVANRLTRRHALPLHATVHDDPAFANALRSKRYLPLVNWIEGQFNEVLVRANSVDVIGEAMADRYRRMLGVEAPVVHRALETPIAAAPEYDPAEHGMSVGVLGSTYSYGQLPRLGKAVGRAAKDLGLRGRVLVIGRSHGERLRADMGDLIDVEVTGHVDEAQGIERLKSCFALYLNYPFARRDAVLRQTSFPTKLSTYVQAARPLLLNVPGDSSVLPLLDEPGFAAHWNSLHPSEGMERLLSLWHAPDAFQSCHESSERIRRRYFDPGANRGTLFGLLDDLVRPGSRPESAT